MGQGAIPSLERAVRGSVTTDPGALRTLGRDGSHLVGRPLAGVTPVDAEDVVALVRWARRHRVALVPRGAGTSLDGESVPEDGAVVVDMSTWRAVRELSVEGRWARVEPGVVNRALQDAVRADGLFFPPNPGSWESCTVGGNVGTNASGPRSYRYGATRAWVRELEVVLGTGERVRLGTGAEKRSLGPDLLGLFVGGEGTLGIITEITVRLAPLPAVRRGLVVPLSPGIRLGSLAAQLRAAGRVGLSAVEYLDATTAGVFPEAGAVGIPPGPLLLLEVEADNEESAQRRAADLTYVLHRAGVSEDPIPFPDAERLWSLRGDASRLLDRQFGSRIREDVAVPIDRVDELLTVCGRIARAEGIPWYLFAHLGDGSLHPNFVTDPASSAAGRIRGALHTAALSFGGTISSEHGVGRLKRGFLEKELGSASTHLLVGIKTLCDPDGILNPGVLLPPGLGRRPSPSPSGAAGARTRPASPSGPAGRKKGARLRRPTPQKRRGSR